VLAAAGQELAEAAALAFAKLRRIEAEAPAPKSGTPMVPDVAFTGSVLRCSSIVREQMIESLRRALPAVRVLPHAVDPIMGALWALRHEPQGRIAG
jgi:hypothetical protein